MDFSFRVDVNDEREYYEWKSARSNRTIKKDFEFPQSLDDLMVLDMDPYYKFFVKMGEKLQVLYERKDEMVIADLRKDFDKMAKIHLYFEFLKLD